MVVWLLIFSLDQIAAEISIADRLECVKVYLSAWLRIPV
jgi:hypothetical protein